MLQRSPFPRSTSLHSSPTSSMPSRCTRCLSLTAQLSESKATLLRLCDQLDEAREAIRVLTKSRKNTEGPPGDKDHDGDYRKEEEDESGISLDFRECSATDYQPAVQLPRTDLASRTHSMPTPKMTFSTPLSIIEVAWAGGYKPRGWEKARGNATSCSHARSWESAICLGIF